MFRGTQQLQAYFIASISQHIKSALTQAIFNSEWFPKTKKKEKTDTDLSFAQVPLNDSN